MVVLTLVTVGVIEQPATSAAVVAARQIRIIALPPPADRPWKSRDAAFRRIPVDSFYHIPTSGRPLFSLISLNVDEAKASRHRRHDVKRAIPSRLCPPQPGL